MRAGLQINKFKFSGGDKVIGKNVADIARAAEGAGFYSVWVMDHFFQIGHLGPYSDPMLEAYTTLGYIAGVTNHVKLGTMVTGVVYRQPALLIKAVTALDVLSNGRAYLGIGAGWNEEEAIGLGLPRPLAGTRFVQLEETLKIALQMWEGDDKPFEGKQFKLEKPHSSPQPLTKPHPPILIGGGGEQKTLRLVAQYGDACNLFAAADVAHKLEVLKQHCADLGTDYDRIEKTAMMGMDVPSASRQPEKVLERAHELAALGVTHVMFSNGDEPQIEAYEVFKRDIVPKLSAM